MSTSNIQSLLLTTGLPVAYSHFQTKQVPPYIVWTGSGQNTFGADDTWYHRRNTYQIEYYFTKKDEANESAIEEVLLGAGYQYTKSADLFIEDQNVYLIYYDV